MVIFYDLQGNLHHLICVIYVHFVSVMQVIVIYLYCHGK